jgi:hypothetical protein
LTGSAGFLEARGTTLTVHTAPDADDPLHGLLPGRPVGLLAIDLVNPAAALLFTDFTSGVTLRLSGTAALEWIAPGTPGDDGGTGQRVRFHPVRTLVTGTPLLTASEVSPSPYNPTVRG